MAKTTPAKHPAPVRPRKGEGVKKPNGGRVPTLTAAVFAKMCETLAQTGAKYKSCTAHGFSYASVMEVINTQVNRGDDSWRHAWNVAHEHFKESLEQEALRRGRDGVVTEWRTNPATGEREPVKREYSDRMLEVLLRGQFPERYRENVHHSGQIGLEPIDAFANLSAKAKRAIRDIVIADLEEQRAAQDAARLASLAQGPVIEGVAVEVALSDLREARA